MANPIADAIRNIFGKAEREPDKTEAVPESVPEPAEEAAPGRDGGIDWRLRDKAIIDSCRMTPRDTQQIYVEVNETVTISYPSLCRRLRRLRKRGKIRHQGTIQRKDVGRPMDYYCGWNVGKHDAAHELDLTSAQDMILGQWLRGRNLDKAINPDAVLVRASITYYVEFDTTEQSGKQLREKWKNYAPPPKKENAKDTESKPPFAHKILFITKGTLERCKNVAKTVPEMLIDRILFTTFDLAMESDSSKIWYGASFKKAVALPL